ncbi:unnamed protein product [Cylicocyclus nassatus]|uniref:Uncharacterized protein n=1 Tax=Cylicocyclus nassatus TaxID=53992 RepID=A0AA36GWV1_CYLNA|nr:unnamed protein product [Cylicocyclus nassatus]
MKFFLLLSIFGIAALGWRGRKTGFGTTHSGHWQDVVPDKTKYYIPKKEKGKCTCVLHVHTWPPMKFSKALIRRECINECEIYEEGFRDGQKRVILTSSITFQFPTPLFASGTRTLPKTTMKLFLLLVIFGMCAAPNPFGRKSIRRRTTTHEPLTPWWCYRCDKGLCKRALSTKKTCLDECVPFNRRTDRTYKKKNTAVSKNARGYASASLISKHLFLYLHYIRLMT